MRRWRGLVLVLLLAAGCASVPVERLRETQFTIESLASVYLLDGTGERAAPVLMRQQTRVGPSHLDWLYDSHYAPSLSPDSTRVACLRVRNDSPYQSSAELRSIQPIEVLLVQVADHTEQIVMSIPGTRTSVTLAPVWSADGTRIFFAATGRVWSYAIGAPQAEPIVEIPEELRGSFRLRRYLRPSRDGGRLLVLLERLTRYASYDVIVEIDLTGRTVTPLWTGKLSRHLVDEVDRPLPREINDDVAEALFGSREHPVYAPRASADRRLYFFDRHEMGLFGRRWVAGYDRVTRREFAVRTMWRTLWWK